MKAIDYLYMLQLILRTEKAVRSGAYLRGLRLTLEHLYAEHIGERPSPVSCPHEPGTAEADAWQAGCERAEAEWEEPYMHQYVQRAARSAVAAQAGVHA